MFLIEGLLYFFFTRQMKEMMLVIKDLEVEKIKIVYYLTTLYPKLKFKLISYEDIKHMEKKQFKSFINHAPLDNP